MGNKKRRVKTKAFGKYFVGGVYIPGFFIASTGLTHEST
jgi:hypothetical protein